MALLTIPGMTEDALLNTNTAPSGGVNHFPCDAQGWTRQTGVVRKCEIKTFGTNDGEKSNISMLVVNGDYSEEVLIDLDTRHVAPGAKDPEKAQQDNLRDLMKIIKVLGAHTNGKLDTDKLVKANGQIVEIIVKHKGFRGGTSKAKFDAQGNNRNPGFARWDGKETLFHDVQAIFKGEVPDLEPVNEKGLPEFPRPIGASASRPPAGVDPMDDLGF